MSADDRGLCKLCSAPLIAPALDLGELPPCNGFLPAAGSAATHPLAMTVCSRCALVQLSVYPPSEAVMPRVPWIRYREPDSHLDDVVARLLGCFGERPGRALGVGPFDAPLLDRLEHHGVQCTLVDLLAPASGETPAGCYPYLETMQGFLRPSGLLVAAQRYGVADLTICRYLIEHSHDPIDALAGLRCLMSAGGLLVLEVPDSSKFLAHADYSFIWEEHISYFTQRTITRLARRAGFEIVAALSYGGALEDALVLVLRDGAAPRPQNGGLDCGAETQSFATYRANFANVRENYRTRLDHVIATGGKIAVFGIGHQAIMFVNALGLQSRISLMVDDDPAKQGHFAPGVSRPIVDSAALLADPDVSVCLLAVPPAVEAKLRTKFVPLLSRGVRMYSIFPGGGTQTMLESTEWT